MTNIMQGGSAWLSQQLQQHASESVRYQRGADSVAVNATVGSQEFDVDHGGIGLQRVDTRDFLIPAADIVLGGLRIEPRRGDRIIDATGNVYEVAAPGSIPPWRESDRSGLLLRIHTQLLERGD